ncbi:hypothetical protein O9G_006178 [Rozella allomycis CSF55]|uniref:Uncharacterized protein n=1 Tax=Rozella allomycis (strain CSF55) TaxID=988480 RepID=A0A075AYU0_ROZAC|nr:hypothetical protein O9G_006178 [Rozella allomycis CSF55]|eukprot:EPZ33882.1 hypothetical protein O9G_006178 [Rozella allomycis CSF55]
MYPKTLMLTLISDLTAGVPPEGRSRYRISLIWSLISDHTTGVPHGLGTTLPPYNSRRRLR